MDLWDKTEFWIGSAQVKPRKTVVNQGSGTQVMAVGYARDKDDFASKVTDSCYAMGLDVMSVGEIERYENRLRRGKVDDEMQRKAESLTPENPIELRLLD